jgi:tetratricopeptide (TPR) repeat protein
MSRTHVYWLLVLMILSTCLCGAQTAPQEPPSAQKRILIDETTKNQTAAPISSAALPEQSTDFDGKVKTMRLDRARAKQTGAQTKEAEAALNEARTLELWTSVDRSQTAHIPEVVDAYQAAIIAGTPQQRSLAANNLAVFLLKQGDPAKALEAFRKVDLNTIGAPNLYLYQYNYGRTLEFNSDLNGAYAHYRDSVTLRPDFVPATEGVSRVMSGLKPPPLVDTAGLADTLVRAGRADTARNLLMRSLQLWGNEPTASRLLGELVRSYEALHVDPQRFLNEDGPFLQKIEGPQLKTGISEMNRAFSGAFPSAFGYSAPTFPYWSQSSYREIFGQLLKVVGDAYAGEKEDYVRALACYSNAWVISRLPEPALYSAALIRDHRELDPSGQLLNQLIDSLFQEKGNAYARQDWPNILRLHTVLGTIFESQQRWGSPSDPRSAVFQWQHAVQAERMVRQTDSKVPPLPLLHLHLANCLVRTGMAPAARPEYLAAAELFLQASDQQQASSAIANLRSLGDVSNMSPGEQQRLKVVESRYAH